jgi:polyisoprenoid-binding protein YceI
VIARLAAAAELPAAGTLKLDPARTVIAFRLAGTLHTTHGTFKLEHGIVSADPHTGAADGTIEIAATSGDSGLAARDIRMKDEILEAAKYPKIVFKPRRVDGRMEKDGEFHVSLRGVMTLHGSEHAMIINVQGRLTGQDLTATCHFSIPYVDWGLKDPSLLFLTVAKSVDLDVETAGRVTWNTEYTRDPQPARSLRSPVSPNGFANPVTKP